MEKQISNISIIGLGLIGGSIAKALKNSKQNFTISAFDKKEVLIKAKYENVIDTILTSPEQAIESDLIFLCLPLDMNIEIFKQIVPELKQDTIITDVSGVKLVFQKVWNSLSSNGTYIGGHPMTGKEVGGYDNSDPLLFENSVYIITEDLTQEQFTSFRKIIELLGAHILHIPPKQHDVIAASVSHLPQLLSIALVNTAALKTDNYNFLDLAAGGFRDMTRIASSDFRIWESVIDKNKNQILTAIEKFSFELNKINNWITENNFEQLKNYFSNAAESRDEIPKNTKGFLTPLYDIFIFVEDQPGVISKISTKLFEAGINIKDIELLKIREGSGGTFRLSFESKQIAEQAQNILSDLGFKFSC